MKLLGVLSTYYPDLIDLERNILSFLDGLDYLIIWENTPKDESVIEKLINKLNNSKIELRTTGKNEFLAYPFNECINWAESQDFTHILTMDQDSSFVENQFDKYKKLIEEYGSDDIAIFSPSKNIDERLTGHIVEVENTITSGSIYRINVFNVIGFFREDFLIYMVDIEYGIRVRKNEFKIICFPDIMLNHEAGYKKKSRIGLHVNMYSAQSTYYIIRNTILTWRLYPEKFTKADKLKFYKYKILYRTIKIVLEPNIFLKLKGIYKGLFHGYLGKSGKYEIK